MAGQDGTGPHSPGHRSCCQLEASRALGTVVKGLQAAVVTVPGLPVGALGRIELGAGMPHVPALSCAAGTCVVCLVSAPALWSQGPALPRPTCPREAAARCPRGLTGQAFPRRRQELCPACCVQWLQVPCWSWGFAEPPFPPVAAVPVLLPVCGATCSPLHGRHWERSFPPALSAAALHSFAGSSGPGPCGRCFNLSCLTLLPSLFAEREQLRTGQALLRML